jgi:hypothetical protein
MRIDGRVELVLDRAQGGRAPSENECAFLLGFAETSLSTRRSSLADAFRDGAGR